MNRHDANGSGLLGECVCALLRLSCVVSAFRRLSRGKVTIIQYHDPKPDVFRRHIDAFSRRYSFIDIDTLAEALEKRDFSVLPRRPLVVTLDDGYKTNADLLDVVRDCQIPVVIYAVAGVVNTNRHVWFKTPGCTGMEIARLKKADDPDRRAILNQRYHYDEREYEERQALSAVEIRDFMAIDGAVVGSHTVFHPQLTMCGNRAGLQECVDSRKILEDLTHRPVRHFAYPDGNSNPRVRGWVESAGYRTARTASFGWTTPTTDPLNLPCTPISDDAGVNKALVQVSGLWDMVKRLIGLRRSGEVENGCWRS